LQPHRQLGIDVEVRAQRRPPELEVHQGKGLGHRTMRVDVHGLDALAVDHDFASAGLGLRGGGGAQLAIRGYETGYGASGRVAKIPAGGRAAGSSPGGLIGVTPAGGFALTEPPPDPSPAPRWP